jgi:hypothetical protein
MMTVPALSKRQHRDRVRRGAWSWVYDRGHPIGVVEELTGGRGWRALRMSMCGGVIGIARSREAAIELVRSETER